MKEDNTNIFLPQILHVQYENKFWYICIPLPLYHFFLNFKKYIFFACNLLWILSWKYIRHQRLHQVCCQESEKENAWEALYSTDCTLTCIIENCRKGDVEREFLGLFLWFISNLHHRQPLLPSNWKLLNCTSRHGASVCHLINYYGSIVRTNLILNFKKIYLKPDTNWKFIFANRIGPIL